MGIAYRYKKWGLGTLQSMGIRYRVWDKGGRLGLWAQGLKVFGIGNRV